jgi:hypothetical protein
VSVRENKRGQRHLFPSASASAHALGKKMDGATDLCYRGGLIFHQPFELFYSGRLPLSTFLFHELRNCSSCTVALRLVPPLTNWICAHGNLYRLFESKHSSYSDSGKVDFRRSKAESKLLSGSANTVIKTQEIYTWDGRTH